MRIRTIKKAVTKLISPGKLPRRYTGKIVEGHKGVAVGDSRKPNISEEHLEKVRGTKGVVAAGDVEKFMYEGMPFFVNSSNVYFARFFYQTGQMLVVYKSNKQQGYVYHGVTENKALDFARTLSKGIWIWNNFRVRGSKTAHKVMFSKVPWNWMPPEAKKIFTFEGKPMKISQRQPRI